MTSKQEKLGTLKRKRQNSKLHILSPSNDIYTGNPFLYTHQSSLHIIFISVLCVCVLVCVCMCTPYNKRRVRRAKLQKPFAAKEKLPFAKVLLCLGVLQISTAYYCSQNALVYQLHSTNASTSGMLCLIWRMRHFFWPFFFLARFFTRLFVLLSFPSVSLLSVDLRVSFARGEKNRLQKWLKFEQKETLQQTLCIFLC